jgi:methionyl-tRNA formyltransferase
MRLVYAGTGGFAMPAFEALIASPFKPIALITQPDKPGASLRSSSRMVGLGLKGPALKSGIPIHQPQSINDPAGLELLKALAPDLLVVAAYGQILSQEALAIPKLGCINLHASILPRHRGASPIAHAVWAGDPETGVSVIRMTPGLDAGEVIGLARTPIGADETAEELEVRLSQMAAPLALEMTTAISSGPVKGIPQDPALVTRAPRLKKDTGNIDWSLTTAEILRLIRAMQPWPTAFTHRIRQGAVPVRIQIVKATTAPTSPQIDGPPGTMLSPDPKGAELLVKTGDGALKVLMVQPSGKNGMPVGDYLRGNPVRMGDQMAKV